MALFVKYDRAGHGITTPASEVDLCPTPEETWTDSFDIR